MKWCDKAVERKILFVGLLILLLLLVLTAGVYAGGAEHGAEAAHAAEHKTLYQLLAEDPWPLLKDMLWRVINFAVLLWILLKATGKPIKNYFANRRETLLQGIQEAREAKEAAERLYREYQDRLASLDDELREMEARFKADAEAEKQRIQSEADEFVAKVKQQAKLMADQEVKMAKHRLKDEAARLAVEAAEKMIRENISASDRQRMVENYLEKVVGAQ